MRPPVTASKSDGSVTLPCKAAQYNNRKETTLADSNQRIFSTKQQDTLHHATNSLAGNGIIVAATTIPSMDRIQQTNLNATALINHFVQDDRLQSGGGGCSGGDGNFIGSTNTDTIPQSSFEFGKAVSMNRLNQNGSKLKPTLAIDTINLRTNHIGNTTTASTSSLSLVPGPPLHDNFNIASAATGSNNSVNRNAATSSGDVQKNILVNQTYDPALIVLPIGSETEPLLRKFENSFPDSSKHTICLNKNSTKLIFVKKDTGNSRSDGDGIGRNSSTGYGGDGGDIEEFEEEQPFSFEDSGSECGAGRRFKSNSLFNHRRSNSANFTANRRLLETARYSNSGRIALQHRRSLQLNYPGKDSGNRNLGHSGSILSSLDNKKQHSHSWYAPIYTALQEEFESDSRELSPVHGATTKTYRNCDIESARAAIEVNYDTDDDILMRSLGDTKSPAFTQKPTEQQPQQQRTTITEIGGQMKQKHHIQNATEGGNRRPRAASTAETGTTQMPKRKRLEVFLKSLIGRKPFKDVNPIPLLPSPEIRITHSPSEHSLLRTNPDGSLQPPTTPSGQINESTSSLNIVQQKLWNVVPLLKSQDSSASLRQEKANTIVQYSGLRKCETVLALSPSSNYLEPIRPMNRLRSYSSISNANCSRCSSFLSLAASGSRYSLNTANRGFVTVTVPAAANLSANENANLSNSDGNATFLCKLCLAEVSTNAGTIIEHCGCIFCTECMTAYIEFEISEGAYEISCPDSQCPVQGILSVKEIKSMSSAASAQKFDRFRLNREIELDKNRTWCPRAGCETICLIENPSSTSSAYGDDKPVSLAQMNCSVHCPTCHEEFCSGCKKAIHPNVTCEENARRLVAEGLDNSIGIPFDNDLIKSCPMCAVPIEKDEGCAQMMCKRCKHVFCWYCLASLDDDFLLRHYDKGPCKNKLGHSRASVVWHRAQVIGIFAGFGILLLVASPLLLLAAPCIICCKCRMCSGSKKLDDIDTDFDDTNTTQR